MAKLATAESITGWYTRLLH